LRELEIRETGICGEIHRSLFLCQSEWKKDKVFSPHRFGRGEITGTVGTVILLGRRFGDQSLEDQCCI